MNNGKKDIKIIGTYKDHIDYYQNKDYLPADHILKLPCGQCFSCRLQRSKMWAIRCMHEASLHQENCFITLTYSPESIPIGNELDKTDFQKFMKRLRKRISSKIRFYHCGEYGSKRGRPHYHAIIFGYDFPDKQYYKTSKGNIIYTSNMLTDIWDKGICTVGEVTYDSCAYTARYIMKKITGKESDYHYIDINTGLIKQKEYVTMSRRPGIARNWLEQYEGDLYHIYYHNILEVYTPAL